MRPAPDRLTRLPPQAFTAMLAAAAAAKAQPGPDFIDLGRGNPDLPPPPAALAALRDAAGVHGYPPFQGAPALREAIAARYRDEHGVDLDPDTEVAVVPGTKTGIMLACLAALEDGDAVALPDPGYPDYLSGAALAGARVVPLPLTAPGWQPDWAALDGEDPALVVLNYPSNPTAAVAAPGTFAAAVARGTWVLHDLAYGFLDFTGRPGPSLLATAGARDVAVELWSPSKVFGAAGWRIGFLVGNAELVGRVKLLVDHLTAGVWQGVQAALLAALTDPRAAEDEARRAAVYRARSRRLADALGIDPPAGTFYAWWRLPEGLTVERVATEARVGIAPGTAFGARGAGYARLSLALPDKELDEALLRLGRLL